MENATLLTSPSMIRISELFEQSEFKFSMVYCITTLVIYSYIMFYSIIKGINIFVFNTFFLKIDH